MAQQLLIGGIIKESEELNACDSPTKWFIKSSPVSPLVLEVKIKRAVQFDDDNFCIGAAVQSFEATTLRLLHSFHAVATNFYIFITSVSSKLTGP